MKLLILILQSLLLVLASNAACLAEDAHEKTLPNEVVIRPHAIRIPVGVFIIVREKDKYCAVRFTEAKTSAENQYEGRGQYEAYYQKDGTGNLLSKNAEHVFDSLIYKEPLSIIGRISIRRDSPTIFCGMAIFTTISDDVGWLYFRDDSLSEPGAGFLMAPTAISDISKIDVFDQSLHWYGYDESRDTIRIGLSSMSSGGAGSTRDK